MSSVHVKHKALLALAWWCLLAWVTGKNLNLHGIEDEFDED